MRRFPHLDLVMFFAAIAAVPFIVSATDYSSSNFTVKDPVIEDGAGRRTSSNFIQLESVGQNAIGISESSNFKVKSGFLYFSEEADSGGDGGDDAEGGGGGAGNVPIHLLPFFAKPLPIIPPEEIREIIKELPCPEGYSRQDLNCDGIVGLIDFSIYLFLSDEKEQRVDNPADFNGDGRVGIADLSILFSAWTERLISFENGRNETVSAIFSGNNGKQGFVGEGRSSNSASEMPNSNSSLQNLRSFSGGALALSGLESFSQNSRRDGIDVFPSKITLTGALLFALGFVALRFFAIVVGL